MNDSANKGGSHPSYDPDARAMNATWGWIAAAVFVVVVLAVAFGIGNQPAPPPTPSSVSLTEASRLGTCQPIEQKDVVFLDCGGKTYSYTKKIN